MEFVERYDLTKVQYLESLGFTEIKPYLGKCKNDDDRRIMYERIQRMCFGIIRNRGMVIRQYYYSYTTPLESGGRLFCGNSIQGMSKSIRGFLVGDVTTDIDIVNAHPVILRYLCKKHNIHCAELDNYVLNRAQVLRQFPDRNKTKKLFLTSVNSDKVIRNNSIILKRFDNEMKDIQKILTGLPEYADIKDSVPDDKKSDNWNGSSINRILCMMENKILRVAITVCNANGVEVFAPMFDGLLVYGSATDDLLRKIETAVEREFPGLGAEWDFKAHETDISIPEGWSVKSDDNVKIANDDAEAARMIYNTIKDRLVYSQKNYYFKTNNVWSSDEHEITRMIRFIVSNSGICRKDSKGETVSYTQNLRNATSITTSIFDIAVDRADDGWVDRVFKSSHGYVLFKNGYWSFKANKFFRNGCDDFNSKIIFMDSIPFDYDESFNDEARITYVNDTLFHMPFGDEVGEYYKLNIARGLAGDCMKRFLVGIGPRNTGKSTISLALKESCGGYYAGWNGAGIAVKNNITDEAQRLRWLLLLRNKRIIVSNELSTNINIDGNMFKKMSNGGADDIVARMHQGYETEFRVGFLPILFAQDLPKITPYDDAVEVRLRSIPYTKEYVNEPSSELHLRMNPDLHSDIATDSFRQAFLRLLFRSYYSFHSNGRVESVPDIIYENTKEVVGCEANVVDTWLCNYEITNNPDDFVLSSDIQKWLDEEKLGITIKKFTMELKRYCLLKNITGVVSKDKKIQGKSVKVWSGCRVPSTDDECLIRSSVGPNPRPFFATGI
jgi:hypothetical protein